VVKKKIGWNSIGFHLLWETQSIAWLPIKVRRSKSVWKNQIIVQSLKCQWQTTVAKASSYETESNWNLHFLFLGWIKNCLAREAQKKIREAKWLDAGGQLYAKKVGIHITDFRSYDFCEVVSDHSVRDSGRTWWHLIDETTARLFGYRPLSCISIILCVFLFFIFRGIFLCDNSLNKNDLMLYLFVWVGVVSLLF